MCRAGGTGVSWSADDAGQPSVEADTTKVFNRYRVPEQKSALARRDIEFLWSPRYQSLGKPLDPGTGAENDLDRLGKSICELSARNPFGFPFTDIRLVFDYLNFANATYNPIVAQGPGFVISGLSPAYDVPNRSHVDSYLYYPGGAPNGDWPALNDRGAWVADFKSPNEDVSTGRDSAIAAVLDSNSISIAGPVVDQVGDTTSARWTRPDARVNAEFDHEFQHMFNLARPNPGALTEMFSTAAEALAGEVPDPPRFDVPFTWSLMRGSSFGVSGGMSNYAAWRSFTAYLAYNFRGTDTTSAGRADDLLWRWAHHPGNNLASLGDRLTDAECAECAAKSYFAGLSAKDRLQLLIHNWRVATYVNNVSLTPDGQYGYAPQFGFVPSRDIGWWQNVDQLASDDSINIPPEVTLTSAERVRERTLVGMTPPSVGSLPHLMALDIYGSEYWVIHGDASLAAAGNDLVATVQPEGVTRGFFECTYTGGRLMASLIGYNGPADSLAMPNALWKHPEYAATTLAPRWVDVDSAAGAVEMELPGFGTTYKAAVVVISLVDGAYGEYSMLANVDKVDDLPYRLNLAIRTAPYLAANPQMVAGLPGVSDAHPTWSPSGDEVAFFSTRGSPNSQIFRRRLSDTTMTAIAPREFNQYAPDWSPRGDLVAFDQELKQGSDGSDIWIKNLQTGELYQATHVTGFATWPVFQPNGQRLVYVRFPGSYPTPPELRRVDVSGANDVALAVLPAAGTLGPPRWTPDGQWVYFPRADSLFAVSAAGGTPIPRANLTPSVSSFDFSTGGGPIVLEEPGQALACGTPTVPYRRISLRDTTAGDTQARFYLRGAHFYYPRWSPDGTRVAYSSDQNGPGEFDTFVGQASFDHAPKFSPPLRDTALALPCPPYTFALDLNATDSDGQAVTYQAAYLPPGATLTGNHFAWVNPSTPGKDYYIVFRALDGSGGVDSKVVKFSLLPDPARPAAANDVTLTMARYTATVNWTAPGDDSLAGTACRYDVRYSTSPITATNFSSLPDTIAMGPPDPAGTPQCAELHSLSSCTWYYIALKTQDDAGQWSALSNVASGRTQCSGYQDIFCDSNGGMFAQSGGGSGWCAENAVLDQARLGELVPDGYQLRSALQAADGRYQVRLLKTGAGAIALDEVALAAVDHAPAAQAFLSGNRILLGTMSPVYRVTDDSGQDLTAALSGGAALPFVGTPGQTLVVRLNESGTPGDALLLETAAGVAAGSADSSGILVQVPQGGGDWTTTARHYPRRRFDRFVADSLGSATVRLVFVGEHQVRSVSRLIRSGTLTPQRLSLAAARHSRLGDVTAAVGASGGTTTGLLAGDGLTLSFAAPALAPGQTRDWALFVRGMRVNPQNLTRATRDPRGEAAAALPTSFALYQNQPNPFATATTFRFDLPQAVMVRLEVFDLMGRRVAIVRDAWTPAGKESIDWDSRGADGSALRPGAYLYRLSAGTYRAQKKLVILP